MLYLQDFLFELEEESLIERQRGKREVMAEFSGDGDGTTTTMAAMVEVDHTSAVPLPPAESVKPGGPGKEGEQCETK